MLQVSGFGTQRRSLIVFGRVLKACYAAPRRWLSCHGSASLCRCWLWSPSICSSSSATSSSYLTGHINTPVLIFLPGYHVIITPGRRVDTPHTSLTHWYWSLYFYLYWSAYLAKTIHVIVTHSWLASISTPVLIDLFTLSSNHVMITPG